MGWWCWGGGAGVVVWVQKVRGGSSPGLERMGIFCRCPSMHMNIR